MSPSFSSLVSTLALIAGFAVQIVWAVLNARSAAANARMSEQLTQKFADMEKRVAREYVNERTCRERMELPPLPMVEVVP
jgi:hypothetical protein